MYKQVDNWQGSSCEKISVPFESPSHYYEVLIINKSEVETYTSFAIQDVFALMDEFLEGEEG